jgi:hypothetical protein
MVPFAQSVAVSSALMVVRRQIDANQLVPPKYIREHRVPFLDMDGAERGERRDGDLALVTVVVFDDEDPMAIDGHGSEYRGGYSVVVI